MEVKNKHNHGGHRQRLKAKVKKFGLNAFAEHEILELLLTYCIPRKDTNSLAHALINKFGSFARVLEADSVQLKEVEGIGEESALFLTTIHKIFEYYLSNRKTDGDKNEINSPESSVKYFRNHFRIKNNETFVGLCLNGKGIIVDNFSLVGDSETKVDFTVEFLTKYLVRNAVKQLIIFHTHPHGEVEPSIEDDETTKRIIQLCVPFGVELNDHVIINNSKHYSYRANGKLDSIKKDMPYLCNMSKTESLIPTKK